MNPLVSIIIPCYNYGRYLAEAIESAIAQTYNATEIIVVNDGSTDNTIEVASQYPVRLFNQSNQGAAKTFNRGIRLSKGKYFVILSADDKLHPCFVEKTLPILEKDNNIAFVYTHATLFGAKKGIMICREYNIDSLRKGNYITGTVLTKKKAFNLVKGFNPDLKCLEDWDLWLSFAEHRLYGTLLPEPLFYYRQHLFGGRNVVKYRVLLFTTIRIWKNHRSLYTPTLLLTMILRTGLLRILRGILTILEIACPAKLRKKIAELKQTLVFFKGCEIKDIE